MTDARIVAKKIKEWCNRQESIKAVRALSEWVYFYEKRLELFPMEFSSTAKDINDNGILRIGYELGILDGDYNLKED
jgi:hypothetical protein